MGSSISALREEAKKADRNTRMEMEERLQILEKMVHGQLDKQQKHIIAGERGDQEIYSGTVVEEIKQVQIVMQEKASQDLEDAVDSFFSGSIMKGIGKLISLSIKAVLGNSSMGEYETSSMLIMWTDNALLRLDTYYYRWNFASKGIIDSMEGVIGMLMVKRVIDVSKTDPQVLTWAISRQASLLEKREDETIEMIEEAMKIIKKVAIFQNEVKMIENGQLSKT